MHIDDGDVMFLWLGADVEEDYWHNLFGISNSHALNPTPVRIDPFLSI